MDMAYFFHIFYSDRKAEFDLSEKSPIQIGSGKKSDFKIPDLDPKCRLEVKQGANGVDVTSTVPFEKSGESVKRATLAQGDTCVLSRNPLIVFTVYDKKADSSKTVDLSSAAVVKIGRGSQNSIRLSSAVVSGNHAEITGSGDGYILTDLGSTNGTYINGKKVKSERLDNNDVISIGGYRIIISNGILFFRNTGADLSLDIESASDVVEKREYPAFQKSTRLLYETPSGDVEIQTPPFIGGKPELNLISMLLPSLTMLIPMAIGLFMGPMGMGFLSLPSVVIGVILSVANYKKQAKSYKKNEQARLDKYGQYIKEISDDLEEKATRQRDMMNAIHPAAQICFQIAHSIERRLWERTPGEQDFLSLRLGAGSRPFGVSVRTPRKNVTLEEDSLLSEAEKIAAKYKTIKDVPIFLSLLETPTIGVVGERAHAVQIAQNLIVQAATHHSYDELKIVTLFPSGEEREWNWIRWLPHSWDDTKSNRFMAMSRMGSSSLLRELDEILKQRERDLQSDDRYSKTIKLPYILFIIADRSLAESEAIMRHITQNNPFMGVGAIMLFDNIGNLPSDCRMIVEARNGGGQVYRRDNAGNAESFIPDKITGAQLDRFARDLAPIQLKAMTLESALPGCITFLQGYGVKRPNEINLAKNWSESLNYRSMAVPIGVKSNGDTFYFDIHEKAHGPHGLVAGMTGSGKSEMVQSWILSMALHFSPRDVSFVLIDFKGTGLILPFMNMPHLAGTISDLDRNIHRNLIALENELSRRKMLLDKYGVNNINAYLKLFHEGKAGEPVSILFVIVDEFAEFKVQFPDFMTVVNRIFAIGRTLGVFIILLTQKPSGVVDDKMNANTRFRWCLKVASSADSKEMLKHPDAAKITVPGRGYVQVGEDEIFELVQSFWSGAPYNPNAKARITTSINISLIELDGKRQKCEDYDKTVGVNSELNEIDAIVKHIAGHIRQNGIPATRAIWEPKLRISIALEELLDQGRGFNGEAWLPNDKYLSTVIGQIDDPRSQSQYPLELNVGEDGNIAVYGSPGTGKTTLLQTFIVSLARSYAPDEVNIYVMDFGGWSMSILSDIPHIGGIANDNEDEKIKKLARLLTKELDDRKRKFAKEGAQNIQAYREISGEQLPAIVLVLDNFVPVYGLYPNLEPFFLTYTQQGGGYGMYFVVSANSTMSLGFKMAQNIKMAIALQLVDKADYPSIVGKTDGLVPDNVSGRGLVKGLPPLEFQTALPAGAASDSERVEKIKELCRLMNMKWTGKRAAPIPVMPEIIAHGSLAADGRKIPVGLGTIDINPVYIDLDENHYGIISGLMRSGKSNLLTVIAKYFKELDGASLAVFDSEQYSSSPLKDAADHYMTAAAEFDEYIESLVPILQERRELYSKGNKPGFSPYAIVIDDIKYCFDNIKDETINRLEAILRLGKGLNVNIFAAGLSSDIVKLYSQSEKFTAGMVNNGVNILLGGKANSHSVFETGLSYMEKETELGAYEGYLQKRGNVVRFKTIYA